MKFEKNNTNLPWPHQVLIVNSGACADIFPRILQKVYTRSHLLHKAGILSIAQTSTSISSPHSLPEFTSSSLSSSSFKKRIWIKKISKKILEIDLLQMTSKRSIWRIASKFRRWTEQKLNENYVVYMHLSSTKGISARGLFRVWRKIMCS